MGNVVQASQFGFNNNLGQALQQGLNLGNQFRQGQEQKRLQGLQQQFFAGGGLGSTDALQQAGNISADFQKQVAGQLGLIDERTGQVNQARLVEAADFAFKIQNKSLEQQNIAINKRIEEVESRGGDATQSRQLLTLPFEQRSAELEGVQVAALPNETRLKFVNGEFNRDRIKSFAPQANAEGGLSIPQVAADGSVSRKRH